MVGLYSLHVKEWKSIQKELKFTLSKSRLSDPSFREKFTLNKEWKINSRKKVNQNEAHSTKIVYLFIHSFIYSCEQVDNNNIKHTVKTSKFSKGEKKNTFVWKFWK